MGIDDLVNQGKHHYEANKDKIDGFLNSEKAEEVSDPLFDSAADIAKKISPEQFDSTVEDLRGKADGSVGTEP